MWLLITIDEHGVKGSLQEGCPFRKNIPSQPAKYGIRRWAACNAPSHIHGTCLCFVITMCWWVIALVPAVVLGCRYFYSMRVLHGYLKEAMSRDMGDIEGFYRKSPNSCLWVAVLEDRVVGLVAAVDQQRSSGAVELQRMSVDRRFWRCGVGVALGLKVLDFAAAHGYSTVELGTRAYTPAAHQLYQRLGFHCVGVTNGNFTPRAGWSLMEKVFYKFRHHYYSLDVQNC